MRTASTLRWAALSVLVGSIIGMFAAKDPAILILGVIAACGLALGRRPALLLCVFVVVDETFPGSAYYVQIGKLITTGHQLYKPVKGVPPSLLLLALGLGMLLYTGRGVAAAKLHSHGLDGIGVVLMCLLLWTTMLSLAQEQVDFSAGSMLRILTNTLTAVMPWLLMLVAYAVAIRMLREPGGREEFTRVLAGALVAKGVLGLLVLVTTHGAVVDGQHNVVYFDATLPMIAGMAIIGYLLATQQEVRWRKVILFLTATIVLFSFRRCVWSAMAIAVVALPLVRQRTAIIGRVLSVIAVSLLVLLVLPASLKRSAFDRIGSAVSVAQGGGNDHSAQDHKNDVQRGYQIAQDHAWLGIGVRAKQRREFAFQDINRVYVHNDLLQVWLRLGVPGITLYALLLAVLCWRGFRTLRRGQSLTIVDAGCAAFAFVILMPLMTAPFISETTRWPVIVGIVAAVLRAHATDALDEAAAQKNADRAAGLAAAAARRNASTARA